MESVKPPQDYEGIFSKAKFFYFGAFPSIDDFMIHDIVSMLYLICTSHDMDFFKTIIRLTDTYPLKIDSSFPLIIRSPKILNSHLPNSKKNNNHNYFTKKSQFSPVKKSKYIGQDFVGLSKNCILNSNKTMIETNSNKTMIETMTTTKESSKENKAKIDDNQDMSISIEDKEIQKSPKIANLPMPNSKENNNHNYFIKKTQFTPLKKPKYNGQDFWLSKKCKANCN